tara:strand:- start:329 stop:616 length:288 start_codon:yes stop_codon:yes gene_type:complete
MNIEIIKLLDNRLPDNIINIKNKKLAIPSVLYYENYRENKNLLDIINNFECSKTCDCIELDLYKNLIDNIKIKKHLTKKYNKKLKKQSSKKKFNK